MLGERGRGRLVGGLTFLQLVGLIVPFVLLLPIVTPPAYLADAAASSTRIRAGVLLLAVNGAVTIGISIAAWPTLRRTSEALALWLVVLGALMLGVQMVDNIHILSMLSLSQAHAAAGASADSLRDVATAIGTTRRWAHLSELLVIDAWILVFYLSLIRARALPRLLSAFGLLTVAAHFVAIPLPGFLGLRAVAEAGMPMALSHVATAGWLVAKGLGGPWAPSANLIE
jgi:Domain of unknown function (DUF4386)